MNFFEPSFFVFLSALLIVYSLMNSNHKKIVTLLGFSYAFYAYWNWRFLPLILVTTYVDFFCGNMIAKDGKNKKWFLAFSLSLNLLILFVFKYYDFFITGIDSRYALNLILPVGISFYTFQSMSYTLDVFYDKNKRESSYLNYSLYVSFFPQLVAGPIERSSRLVPQFLKLNALKAEDLREGFQLALFGFFKKLVIADNLALVVDQYFGSIKEYSGLDTMLVIYAYAFQIYFDFSSYTDIARGVAKMFGIDLVQNFNLPYLSASLTEFWKRWHISLTSWFRDYVYYPLCFNRFFRVNLVLATLIVFLLSGFWHGASWNFVVWGGAHGIILMLEALTLNKFSELRENKLAKIFAIVLNFHLVSFLWVIFRAKDMSSAFAAYSQIFRAPVFLSTNLFSLRDLYLVVLILVSEIFTWHFLNKNNFISSRHATVRWAFYIVLIVLVGLCGNLSPKPYIYFQF